MIIVLVPRSSSSLLIVATPRSPLPAPPPQPLHMTDLPPTRRPCLPQAIWPAGPLTQTSFSTLTFSSA
eukprot:4377475-Pyramimonas_sp.AAC.1